MNPAIESIKRLHKHLKIEPFDGKFDCEYYLGKEGCKRSLQDKWGRHVGVLCGDWPYIGVEYGRATVSGKTVSIVVVGMDGGGQKEMDRRFSERQQDWYGGFKGRNGTWHNAHVAGTNLAVRELVDDKDPESYLHRFCYINSVKCTPKVEGMSSKATSATKANCANHLQSELTELKPNLLLVEGRYPERMIMQVYGLAKPAHQYKGGYRSRLYIEPDKPVVLALPHPSARGIGWGILAGQLPPCYLKAIRKARRLIGDEPT